MPIDMTHSGTLLFRSAADGRKHSIFKYNDYIRLRSWDDLNLTNVLHETDTSILSLQPFPNPDTTAPRTHYSSSMITEIVSGGSHVN